jgi:hypothetical protein
MAQFVPAEEIQKLTLGSFEHIHARLSEALAADSAFAEMNTKVIGTFPGYAIVGSGDGKFFRVQYESAQSGQTKIVHAEPLQLAVYDESNLDDYLMKQARGVADAFIEGRTEDALAAVSELSEFVEDRPKATDEQVVKSLVASLHSSRPWKKLYKEKADEMRAFVKESLDEIERARLAAKFTKLHDGSMTAEQAEGFRDLVKTDLAYLSERLGALSDLVEISVKSVNKVADQIEGMGEEGALITFGAFSEDLLADLRESYRIAAEAPRHVSSVSCLGELYDALTEEVYQYDVSGRFVERMAQKLCNDSK